MPRSNNCLKLSVVGQRHNLFFNPIKGYDIFYKYFCLKAIDSGFTQYCP